VTLALLQKGTGGPIVAYAGPMGDNTTPSGMPAGCLEALGPKPCVVGMNARGPEALDEILAFARSRSGRPDAWLAALIGFSAGCMKVRALRLAGADALALVLADGLHANKPPADWQLTYARDIAAQARAGRLLTIITHTYQAPPTFTSTADMARAATGWPLAPPPEGQTVRRGQRPPGPDWAGLVVYSTGTGDADQPAHVAQATRLLPLVLATHVRPLVELGDRPAVPNGADPGAWPEPAPEVVQISGGSAPPGGAPRPPPKPAVPAPDPAPAPPVKPQPLRLRDRVFVAGVGWMAVDDDYVARVVTGELGMSRQLEALKAQAVAARTFLQRALRDDPALGTPEKPVPSSEKFQVAARVATPLPLRATAETRGGVMLWRGQLIIANHVAGAVWAPGARDGRNGHDATKTERWVTYNEGRRGSEVQPSPIASRSRPDNRGCMSQNGADALAARGYRWSDILRFFYGDDIDLTIAEWRPPEWRPPAAPLPPYPTPAHPIPAYPAPRPVPPSLPAQQIAATSSSGGGTGIAIAAAIAAWRLMT
jgi:hypothetical protein